MNIKIANYSCYRKFILDKFNEMQQENPNISYQYIANRLKTSRLYIKFIMENKRHISIEKIPPLCKIMKLEEWESRFFLILFLKNTTKNQELSDYFNFVLGKIEGNTLPKVISTNKLLEEKQLTQNWLAMVIHSMSKMTNFQPDVSWIKSHLRDRNVNSNEIEKQLNYLLEKNMIIKEKTKWRPANFVHNKGNEFVLKDSQIYAIGVNRIQESLIDVSQYSPNSFAMMTLGIKKSDQKKVVELYAEFTDKLMALSKETKESEVVMFVSNNLVTIASLHDGEV